MVRLFVKKPCYFNKNIFGSLSTTCWNEVEALVDDEEPDEIVRLKVDVPCVGDTIIVGELVYPLPPFTSVIVVIKIDGDEPVHVKLHVAPEPPPEPLTTLSLYVRIYPNVDVFETPDIIYYLLTYLYNIINIYIIL